MIFFVNRADVWPKIIYNAAMSSDQAVPARHATRRISRLGGFSLVETVVSIGIVMILMSLALPAFGSLRNEGRRLASASNLRQIGLAYSQYTDENDGKPPVIMPPIPVWTGDEMIEIPYGDDTLRGWYFANAWFAYLAFNPPLPPQVLKAPENPSDRLTTTSRGVTSGVTDYEFTNTLWADPEFWNPVTAYGPDQWNPQPMHRVLYPSSKGLVFQSLNYVAGARDDFGNHPGWEIPVLWFDQSLSRQPVGELIPGVVNIWMPDSDPETPPYVQGFPLRTTRDGVLGRDR